MVWAGFIHEHDLADLCNHDWVWHGTGSQHESTMKATAFCLRCFTDRKQARKEAHVCPRMIILDKKINLEKIRQSKKTQDNKQESGSTQERDCPDLLNPAVPEVRLFPKPIHSG